MKQFLVLCPQIGTTLANFLCGHDLYFDLFIHIEGQIVWPFACNCDVIPQYATF